MSKIKAFTFVESLIALAVTALGIGIILGVTNSSTILQRHQIYNTARNHWSSLVDVLNSPKMDFKLYKVSDKELFLYQNVENRVYRLKCLNNKVYLTTNDKGGTIPLLVGISEFKYTYNEPSLTITGVVSGYKFKNVLVLEKYKDDKK